MADLTNLLGRSHLKLQELSYHKSLIVYLIDPAVSTPTDATVTSHFLVIAGDEFYRYAINSGGHHLEVSSGALSNCRVPKSGSAMIRGRERGSQWEKRYGEL